MYLMCTSLYYYYICRFNLPSLNMKDTAVFVSSVLYLSCKPINVYAAIVNINC